MILAKDAKADNQFRMKAYWALLLGCADIAAAMHHLKLFLFFVLSFVRQAKSLTTNHDKTFSITKGENILAFLQLLYIV